MRSIDPGDTHPGASTSLSRAIRAYARLDRAVQKTHQRGELFLGGLLSCSATEEELTGLTVAMYADGPPSRDAGDLMPFERGWFERDLPAPPAHILVAAAGFGRECRGLLPMGYRLDAFDPVAAAVDACRQQFAEHVDVECGSFDQLLAAMAGHPSPLERFARRRYEAVLIGHGAFAHVYSAAARQRLLQACTELTDGPILLSFPRARAQMQTSRPYRAGRAVGIALGKLRRREVPGEDGTFAVPHGFLASVQAADVQRMADSLGRTCRCHDLGYPHATLAGPEQAD